MQGIFIDGRRPKSKKEIKEAVKDNPARVDAEATSFFGNEFSGPVDNLTEGQSFNFVGPDPYRKRSFYGSITKSKGKIVVS